MIKKGIIQTKFSNFYLFDNNKKYLLYLTPSLIDQIEERTVDNIYYREKILFLKQHNIFLKEKNRNFKTKYDNNYIDGKLKNLDVICLEVTQKCNLRCHYCTYGDLYIDNQNRFKIDMSVPTALTFIDFLFSKWESDINNNATKTISFYGGEPLLNIRLIKKVILYIKQKNSDRFIFKFNITTNGILLKRHIKYLIEENFNILVSIDGDQKANSFRVNTKKQEIYNQLMSNLDYVKDLNPDYFQKKISFNSLLNCYNSIYDLDNFFRRNFPNNNFSISSISDSGIKKEKVMEFEQINYNHKNEKANRSMCFKIEKSLGTGLVENYNNLNNKSFSYNFNTPIDMLINDNHEEYIPTGTCNPFDKIFVNAKGEIIPCERINDKYKFGFVSKQKVVMDFTSISSLYDRCFKKIINKCAKCFYFEICQSCIFNMDNSIDSKRFNCPNYMSREKYINYIKSFIQDVEVYGLDNIIN